MTLLESAVQFIAMFEGFRSKPYLDQGGKATIGYGTTFYDDGTPVTMDDPAIDQDEAAELLSNHVQKILDRLVKLVTVSLNDDQTIALASFEYNTGHLANSTLLTKLNAGDYQGAAEQFLLWVHVEGQVNQGLMYRRQKEEILFLNEVGS